MGAGGIGISAQNAGGVSLGTNNILNSVTAAITGSSTVTAGSGGVEVKADSSSKVITVTIAGAGGGTSAIGGAVVVNVIQKTVVAKVENSTITASGTVSILANDKAESDSGTFGVGVGLGGSAGGAAIVGYAINDTVKAYADNSTLTSTAGDVTVRAIGAYKMTTATVGGAGGSSSAIGGSIAIHVISNDIQAYVSGSGKSIRANGSVIVEAHNELTMGLGAGGVGIGVGSVGAGIANVTAIIDTKTRAWIGAGVLVTGFGNGNAASVYSGAVNQSNQSETTAFRGVAVTATYTEDITGVTIAGGGGASGGGAGSATASDLKSETTAIIYKGARINTLTGTTPGALQSVRVLASSLSRISEGAGSLAVGGTAGVGAGINAAVMNKTTLASIENGTSTTDRAEVYAAGDISVEAISKENIVSIATTVAFSPSGVSVAGSISVLNLSISTRAVVGNHTLATAGGNLLVAASDATNIGVVSAAFSGLGLGVAVTNKTTEAIIGASALVNAKANSSYASVPNGGFLTSVSDPEIRSVNTTDDSIQVNSAGDYRLGDPVVYRSTGNAIGGLAKDATYYAIPVSGSSNRIKLATTVENARAGTAIDLTSAGSGTQKVQPLGKSEPAITPNGYSEAGLTSKRRAVPDVMSVRGVSVTAVNSDTVEQLAVTLSAATGGGVALSGSAAASTITTRASIGNNAEVNQDRTGTIDSRQGVHVAAGSDFYHIGVAGAAGI
ncbi:MAG: beta strand repeat-containing protein, partial [Planctomycetota bacterium]